MGSKMNYTQEQVNTIVNEARTAAREASDKFFKERLGGQDQFACGFAWVDIYGIKGNTKRSEEHTSELQSH